MMHDLETDRLRLRPVSSEDVDALHALWTLPGVRRYLFDDEVLSCEQVAAFIDTSRTYFEEHGFGLWLVREQEADDLAGFCGYWAFHDQWELLYGLHPDYWGRGFATECARMLIRYGFERLGFEEIIASTDLPNTASVEVMKRLGMRFLNRSTTDGLDTIFYHLPRADYRPASPG